MAHAESSINVDHNPLDFRILVEESLAGIYLVTEDCFLYVNPTMAGFFGLTPEEIVNERTISDLVAPRDRARVRENLRRRLSGEIDILQYTFKALRRDGSYFDAEVRGRRTEVWGAPAVIGTMLDVTERVQEKERLTFLARAAELLDSSLHYQATLESLARLMIPSLADLSVIAIVEGGAVQRLAAGQGALASGDLRVEAVTELGKDVADATTDEVLRMGEGLLLSHVDPDIELNVFERVPERAISPDIRISSLMTLPLVARGEIIGSITLVAAESGRRYNRGDFDFAREVARRAALAVDNARLYREAQEAIRRREEVLAVVSHDLRNPLNVITMTTTLLLERERRRSGPLELVHTAAKQMDHLIRDLLDISVIEAGGLSVNPAPAKIGELVARSVSLHEAVARQRSIRIVNRVPIDLPLALVDEKRFVQAISNLVGNAIKFTPEHGSVEIAAEVCAGTVVISVSDTGPGIQPDELEHIFERFWQTDGTSGDGTGLGLAIVRGIAEAHGGSVRVESVPGQGATFHFAVPLA